MKVPASKYTVMRQGLLKWHESPPVALCWFHVRVHRIGCQTPVFNNQH